MSKKKNHRECTSLDRRQLMPTKAHVTKKQMPQERVGGPRAQKFHHHGRGQGAKNTDPSNPVPAATGHSKPIGLFCLLFDVVANLPWCQSHSVLCTVSMPLAEPGSLLLEHYCCWLLLETAADGLVLRLDGLSTLSRSQPTVVPRRFGVGSVQLPCTFSFSSLSCRASFCGQTTRG